MATQTMLPFTFNERVSAEISWQFQDQDGGAVPSPALLSVTLTLYDVVTNQIINARDDQDILGPSNAGLNNVEISGGGSVTWYVQSQDNAILISGGSEQHIALIEWSWDPDDGHGIRQDRFEIPIVIKDMNRVP
jgi:hypothetical protein